MKQNQNLNKKCIITLTFNAQMRLNHVVNAKITFPVKTES